MTITSLHDGSYEVSDIVNGQRVARMYQGYTLREARRKFLQETTPDGQRKAMPGGWNIQYRETGKMYVVRLAGELVTSFETLREAERYCRREYNFCQRNQIGCRNY